ncbi:AfsR/SARP family transcriptional regulator [Microterricola viridarii]|uniref:DNA-binding transcriptional activator of the SARP family n=1 Tax=Microterricola viridarii TaxID=412690 RepID=A0A109QYR7_9MICO|nr:BTAD domain-containing putative transcriptional regulator [Microterricola viridarii]AMB58785.1 hypothetical protein AWU67_07820 [Microterricola viridarii]
MTLASATPTRIQLCGATLVELDGRRIDGGLPGRQGRVLFAFLVLNRHRFASRAELAAAVWPEDAAAPAASGLNPLLSKLRKILGDNRLEGHSALRLRLDAGARVDVEDAVRTVHRAESQIALGQWHGAWGPSVAALIITEREFLPGEEAEWIDEYRAGMVELHLRALEAYAAATLGIGGTELPAAVRSGRRLVHLAPLRESGYQLLMRALDRQGNSAEALGVYAELHSLLRDELGVSPSAASQAVYTALNRG